MSGTSGPKPTIRIIGGGITGIAAALEASKDESANVELLEASDRLGGKIRTSQFAGRALDEGADAFLLRVPEGADLASEIGLELTHPSAGHASIFVGDELLRIPGGLVLGVPGHFEELAKSKLLSEDGLERAKLEPTIAGMPIEGDLSVEEFISQRYGLEVSQHLVEPLIGGIYGGIASRLSLDAVLPQLAAIAHTEHNCVDALRRQLENATEGPIFGAPISGMGALIQRCHEVLLERGVTVNLNESVERVDQAVPTVIATAGPATSKLVRPVSKRAGELLASIQWSGVVLLAATLPLSGFRTPPTGSGFLVPRTAGKRVTAVSWSSNKWSHLHRSDDEVLARISMGHFGDQAPMELPDDELAEIVTKELSELAGFSGELSEVRVTRYPNGFPQYDVGHNELVEEIERELSEAAPSVRVVGSAHRGVGIPACIRQGRNAVRELMATKR